MAVEAPSLSCPGVENKKKEINLSITLNIYIWRYTVYSIQLFAGN